MVHTATRASVGSQNTGLRWIGLGQSVVDAVADQSRYVLVVTLRSAFVHEAEDAELLDFTGFKYGPECGFNAEQAGFVQRRAIHGFNAVLHDDHGIVAHVGRRRRREHAGISRR